ncbi:MAG: SDR family NAD(P)-dependent oxidoreductase [Acidobacteriota bacterium]
MILAGKTAIVTGGGKGIGKAIALQLGREGARVAICGRAPQPLKETASWLREKGTEVWQGPCDVSQWEQVDHFSGEVEARLGPIDILVNNAGLGGPNGADQEGRRRWRAILAANLDGPYFCGCRVLKTMPDGGRIINVSSVLGKFGVAGYSAYCASKTGIIGLTRALALELVPRRITVNAICPGWVETEMARQGMEAGAGAAQMSYQEFRKSALERVPLGEMLQPWEVAELVSFLASPAAKNITGQAYNICGGQVMY